VTNNNLCFIFLLEYANAADCILLEVCVLKLLMQFYYQFDVSVVQLLTEVTILYDCMKSYVSFIRFTVHTKT